MTEGTKLQINDSQTFNKNFFCRPVPYYQKVNMWYTLGPLKY